MISSNRVAWVQRSQTCWMRGFPAMRWRGFPGKRVEPQRAGRMPRVWVLAEDGDTFGKSWAKLGWGGMERQDLNRPEWKKCEVWSVEC